MTRRFGRVNSLAQGGPSNMIELVPANGGGFFFRVKALNGETLCHSEVYTAKHSAVAGVNALARLMPHVGFRDLT